MTQLVYFVHAFAAGFAFHSFLVGFSAGGFAVFVVLKIREKIVYNTD